MLADLQLKNFRCFDSLALELSPGFNFFIGANGEGKTSILEAACVLLRLQSQRISTLAPLTKVGAKLFIVRGNFDGHGMEFQYAGLRRKLRFDEVEQRIAKITMARSGTNTMALGSIVAPSIAQNPATASHPRVRRGCRASAT